MASESGGQADARDAGHANHFRLLSEQGLSWSGREPNVLFVNRGDGTFEELGNVVGLASRLDSRGAASGDLDGDGDLDLVVYNRNNPNLRIYRNDTPRQGAVLRLDLAGTTGNRDAVGAQAVVRCGNRSVLRTVAIGTGYLSQSERVLHIGLGACAQVNAVEVRWPGGATESWRDLPVDARVRLEEGVEAIVLAPLEPRNANANALPAVAHGSIGTVSARMPVARLDRLDGGEPFEPAGEPGVQVLNFWATWCVPCVAEMPDLQALQDAYAPAGVRFVGVSMDDREDEGTVLSFLAERRVDYEQVWGDLALESELATLVSAPPGSIPLTAIVSDGLVRHVTAGPIEPRVIAEVLDALLLEERDADAP